MTKKNNRLAEFRAFLRLNQTDIAQKIGVHQRNWSRYENGDVATPEEVLIKLAKLGLNLHWFHTGLGKMLLQDTAIENQMIEQNLHTAKATKSLLDVQNMYSKKATSSLLSMQELYTEKATNSPTKNVISNGIESLALESTAPRFAELEEKIGEKLNNLQKDLQAQIDELKGAVEKKQIEEVRESAPTYGIEESSEPEETEDLPLAENLAAGIPIEAFDSGDTYPVPKKFLKRGKKYCVANIRGTSMTEAGIADGSYVLLEYTDTALPGEIMVVKYGDQTTLKRLSQKEDGAWELLYEDGSQAKIELKDGDWEVKGHYVRVVGDCRNH